jgi:tRNA G18 (ribose-2'-O)-methylase SpoU
MLCNAKDRRLILILDNIRSRENVGSIFRSADAFGVGKIYLCGITPIPPHDKISKSALGADEFVPWEYAKRTVDIVKRLKKNGIKIIALEQSRKSINLIELDQMGDVALVVGNEVEGVGSGILKLSDRIIEIPMHGKKESLNVSVATGIALYAITNKK